MSKHTAGIGDELTDATLQRLRDLRRALLHLHKTLLEMERVDYERLSGRVNSGELLQLVISHAQFAWLRPISALIVQIDEMLGAEGPLTLAEAQNLFTEARLLLASSGDEEFREKYQSALQRGPAAVMAHAAAMNVLGKETRREHQPGGDEK